MLAANSSLASSEASIASMRISVAELPEQLTMQQTTGFPNVAADSMRQELFKLQITQRELEANLGEKHPLTKATSEQVRKSESILNSQAPERTQTSQGINPSRQTLDLELRREEALAASLRAKADTLNQQYANLQRRMHTLNEDEVRISELERQTAIVEANYRSYVEHLEQARIGQALEANRISNVNVVQPPSLVEKPVSPKPLMILGLSFLAAVGGALGLAFGLEYLDKSPNDVKELNSPLTVPGLGSIQHTPGTQVVLNR
jgi:uncharacterized protein involved in exopolysaccharide biosynthesis